MSLEEKIKTLPIEIVSIISYYTLEHPVSVIIKSSQNYIYNSTKHAIKMLDEDLTQKYIRFDCDKDKIPSVLWENLYRIVLNGFRKKGYNCIYWPRYREYRISRKYHGPHQKRINK